MLKLITMETLHAFIEQNHDINTIELQYLDPTGGVHSMMLMARKVSKDGKNLEVVKDIAGTLDGSSIPGFQNIDKTGLEILPGENPRIYVDPTNKSNIVIMGNTKEPNGPYYEKDPRYQAIVAEKWLKEQNLGLDALRVGPEFEFFVFPKGVDPLALHADNTSYHCSAADNPSQEFITEYCLALQSAGVDIRFSHSEVASYQQEVGINCETLLRAADNVIIQREILKKLAAKHGVTVSWEPKLLDAYHQTIKKTGKDTAINGNGLHTNLSFDKTDGTNSFVSYDDKGVPITNQLSDDAMLSIAGLLKHANALQAFFNPSTISGMRLGMGESPKFIVAGNDNRSALVRIVTISKGEEVKTRIELRASDSMICSHTWFVAAQMAMVDAIKKGRGMSHAEREAHGLIPRIINTNFYQMSDEERVTLGIPELHIGKDILKKSIESLQQDHDYLLIEGGPFGNDFETVLGPYISTILEVDENRELCRKVSFAKWIEANAKKRGYDENETLKDTMKEMQNRIHRMESALLEHQNNDEMLPNKRSRISHSPTMF